MTGGLTRQSGSPPPLTTNPRPFTLNHMSRCPKAESGAAGGAAGGVKGGAVERRAESRVEAAPWAALWPSLSLFSFNINNPSQKQLFIWQKMDLLIRRGGGGGGGSAVIRAHCYQTTGWTATSWPLCYEHAARSSQIAGWEAAADGNDSLHTPRHDYYYHHYYHHYDYIVFPDIGDLTLSIFFHSALCSLTCSITTKVDLCLW